MGDKRRVPRYGLRPDSGSTPRYTTCSRRPPCRCTGCICTAGTRSPRTPSLQSPGRTRRKLFHCCTSTARRACTGLRQAATWIRADTACKPRSLLRHKQQKMFLQRRADIVQARRLMWTHSTQPVPHWSMSQRDTHYTGRIRRWKRRRVGTAHMTFGSQTSWDPWLRCRRTLPGMECTTQLARLRCAASRHHSRPEERAAPSVPSRQGSGSTLRRSTWLKSGQQDTKYTPRCQSVAQNRCLPGRWERSTSTAPPRPQLNSVRTQCTTLKRCLAR